MRTEDGYIVRRVLNGEPEAFGLLVDRYKASIYAFAYVKLRNFHDAEDVAQEVFIKAYQKLRELRRYDSFLAWLYSIASDLCRKFVRAQSKRPDREFIEDQEPEVRAGISTDLYYDDAGYEFLHEALNSLPEMYRQVLTLYYLGGMTSREIARFLGKSPTAIRQRLSRARAQLREEVLAMTRTTFEGQRLQASFTFRVVETVRRIKITPTPRMAGLPWGLSLAAGIIVTVLSLNPYISIQNPTSMPAGSPLPSQAKVLDAGEIPVDILEIFQMPLISSRQGAGGNGVFEPTVVQDAFFLAPRGEGNTWTKKADMPTPRHGLTACAVNGKIYVMGGSKPGGTNLSTVEEYDPATDEWRKVSNMPSPRARLAGCVVNDKIYAIGGWPNRHSMEEYDPATDKWTRKANMIAPAERFAACELNGKIYTFGGWFGGFDGKMLAAISEYDPATDTWTKKADLPELAEYFSASGVNGKIYIIGAHFPNVLEYDPIKDKYTQKAAVLRRGGEIWVILHSASVVHDKIYIIGGYKPYGTRVAVYDPATDTWEEKADMPTARCWLATGVVNGKIYAIGGATQDLPTFGDVGGIPAFSTVEEYDTGFREIGVDARGKIPEKWGKVKSE